jgi:hypothetical protein
MTQFIFEAALAALLLGSCTYMVVWGLHNFDITVDTVMQWADRQDTFLQKMISCPVCLSIQVGVALSSLTCLAFGIGLWRWAATTLLTCLVALVFLRKLKPLDE